MTPKLTLAVMKRIRFKPLKKALKLSLKQRMRLKSQLQKTVALSVTEAEFDSGVSCAQDMLFAMRVLESLGLKVAKPMVLRMDNKGAKDLVNSWNVTGRTRHVAVRQCFLQELKEDGIIRVEWISTKENEADLFTKNLGGPTFEKHARKFVGDDVHMTLVLLGYEVCLAHIYHSLTRDSSHSVNGKEFGLAGPPAFRLFCQKFVKLIQRDGFCE